MLSVFFGVYTDFGLKPVNLASFKFLLLHPLPWESCFTFQLANHLLTSFLLSG